MAARTTTYAGAVRSGDVAEADRNPVWHGPISVEPILWDQAVAHWDKAGPLIRRVLGRVETGFREEDVLRSIHERRMQLWAVNDWQAVAVTEVEVRPEWKVLVVVHLAGDEMGDWLGPLLDTLEEYAREIGCRSVEACGRRGWVRSVSDRGYREVMTVIRKELGDG